MIVNKDYKGLKNVGWRYELKGDLISDEDIKIELDMNLYVSGSTEAGWGITAGCGIEAGWGITAGDGIEAGCGIEAGWGITAGDGIEAGWGITAGDGITAGCGIEAGDGIEAGWGITAGDGITAGCGIEAGDGIEAGWGITAGDGITAGLTITAKWLDIGLRIFAGLCLWKIPSEEKTMINVEEIKNGEVCYGKLNILKPKEIKEMTISEISKELGYDIKVVKENE